MFFLVFHRNISTISGMLLESVFARSNLEFLAVGPVKPFSMTFLKAFSLLKMFFFFAFGFISSDVMVGEGEFV